MPNPIKPCPLLLLLLLLLVLGPRRKTPAHGVAWAAGSHGPNGWGIGYGVAWGRDNTGGPRMPHGASMGLAWG